MIRLAVVVMIAGCFTKPGLVERDGGASDGRTSDGACTPSKPSTSGVYLGDENGEVTANMIASRMTFASDGTRYPFPISMRVGPEELLSASATCDLADRVGMRVSPLYAISAQEIVGGVDHALTRSIVGAAYTELQVRWSYEHTCSMGTSFSGNGTSTFGFYPDSRIVRIDTIQPVDNLASIDSDNCPCEPDPDLFVSSYLGLDAGILTSYLTAGSSTPTAIPPNEIDAGNGGCFTIDGGDVIAVRWAMADTTRISRTSTSNVMFSLDLLAQSSLGDADEATGRTQMMLRPDGSCEDLNRELANHHAPQRIRIGTRTVDVDAKGYFDDAVIQSHLGPATITASNGRIEQGFSLRIRFPGFSAVATERSENRVFWQHEEEDVFFLTFRDSLESGESFEITPECGG